MQLLVGFNVAIYQQQFKNGGMPAGHQIDEALILANRGRKTAVDPRVPYAFLVEPEVTIRGTIEDVATIFLTNRECPFHCLFCDLWKNTTDEAVPLGAIPQQIDYALQRLSTARHVKLYNSGNFFDHQAIPPDDYAAIAERVAHFQTIIVENHPRLCGKSCVHFRDFVRGAAKMRTRAKEIVQGEPEETLPELEVALGLETVHPEILPRLNKQMTLDDFRKAAAFLASNEIAMRAFILLKPPYMLEEDCVDWVLRSIEFAFICGVRACSVIPTRSGNGVMDLLEQEGRFSSPHMASLEATLAGGIALGRGRVFVDLWDVARFYSCARCGPARGARLQEMNLTQRILPAIECSCT